MIWCVEDDASIRDIEVYALQSTGFEAKGFEDGQAFWNALQAETPELVVLDVMLPGLDGIELLRRMNTIKFRVWIWARTTISQSPSGSWSLSPA